jgi:hypothetical protein
LSYLKKKHTYLGLFIVIGLFSLCFLFTSPIHEKRNPLIPRKPSSIEAHTTPLFPEKEYKEFQVNNYTTESQRLPSTCALSEEIFVVAWDDFGHNDNYARVFNATTGLNITAEFRLNEYTLSYQEKPSVCALSDDKFAAVWESWAQEDGPLNSEGIYASVFNATTGERITSEFQVNNYTDDNQENPSVCALSEDTIAVAWQSKGQDNNSSNKYGIFATILNATTGENITAEFRVNYHITNNQINPSICALSEDNVAVTWQSSGQDPDDSDGIYARIFNATTGANITSEFRVNNYTLNTQTDPSVSALSHDSFAITWDSSGQDGSQTGVYARVYNATTGLNTTAEFQVNDYSSSFQQDPTISTLSESSFAIAWQSSNQDGNDQGVFASVFNATTGDVITEEFQVNEETAEHQRSPSISALSEDKFAVAWQSEDQDGDLFGIFGNIFSLVPNTPPEVNTPTPSDDSTDIGINPTLQVNVSDINGQDITVYFYDNTTGTPNLIGMDTVNDGGPGFASLTWSDRICSIEYSWFVNVSDGIDNTTSTLWSFTVESNVPPVVNTPSPADSTTDIGINPTLQVNVSDENGHNITVYFYDNTTGTPNLIGMDTVNDGGPDFATFTWNGRDYGKEYSWFVNASDGIENTTSTMWSFTTVVNNAPTINNPSPAFSTTGVSRNPTLRVNVSDADGHDITVYFYDNTTGTPSLIGTDTILGGGSGNATFNWTGRASSTEYKWFVKASDGIFNTTSNLWTFTTEAEPSNPPPLFPTDQASKIPGYQIYLLIPVLGISVLLLIWKSKNSFL